MKAAGLLLLFFAGITLVCCRNNPSGGPSSKCSPCPLDLEDLMILPVVDVRIVDKVTGNDLFLSPNSPYKPSDLSVTSSLSGKVNFNVDSTITTNRYIILPATESQTFTFQLATLAPDSIRVTAAQDSPVCCPRYRIKSITLDGVQLCGPCGLTPLITIKK